MLNRLLWIRITRDLRKRWIQVCIVTIILGIGTGAFWGLFSGVQWRIDSVNQFMEEYSLDDGIISFPQGYEVNYSEIVYTMARFPRLNEIKAWDMRLKCSIAYEFNSSEGLIVIRGYMYGLQVKSFAKGEVDRLALDKGRFLGVNDINKSCILLESTFCQAYSLQNLDDLNIRFLNLIQNVKIEGMVISPEWLIIFDPESTAFSASVQFGIGYALLQDLQAWSGLEDSINEIVFCIKQFANDDSIGQSLKQFLEEEGFPCAYQRRKETPLIKTLDQQNKDDIDLMTVIALLIIFIALFALWISINRMITQQRRDIGIELSLGTNERSILFYYIFYGLIIASLGIIIGLVLGNFIGEATIELYMAYMLIPNLKKPILWDRLYQAIILGLLCSFLASFWPARNGAKMIPINALRQDPALGGSSYKNPKIFEIILAKIVSFSLSSRIAARNIFRNRKRTFATISGISLSLALIIAYLGAFDSFIFLKDSYSEDLGDWDLRVTFNVPINSDQIVFANDTRIADINYGLAYFAEIQRKEDNSSKLIELKGYNGNLIPQKIVNGTLKQNLTSIAMSKELANELGIKIGEKVTFKHFSFDAAIGATITQTSLEVGYWHNRVSKLEVLVPWELIQSMFNLIGSTNQLLIKFTSDVNLFKFREYLYSFSFVRIVELHEDLTRDLKDVLEMFQGLMQIMESLTLSLCFGLILLTAMINNSEREREHGTMMTLGASDMSILRISIWEAIFLSIIGILIGDFLGWLLLDLMLMPAFQAAYNIYVIKAKIQLSTTLLFSTLTFFIAITSQLGILFTLRKMELSEATKVRDF
ncbi:MAG: FtsX-like permease family protein [Candidatus Hodarchaeota archaeon]